jgi:hypothetical protein
LRLVFPGDDSNATTIDVRCQDRFVFAANPAENGWTASFRQNVEMVRNNPDRTIDRLTADEVHLTLTSQGVDNKTSQFDRLEPALFVARGRPGHGNQPPVPARLSVKQGGDVTLLGDEIFLDLRQNFMSLATRTESGASPYVEMIVDDQYVIKSERSVRYTFGQDGAFGRFIADGKGNLTGKIGDGVNARDIRLDWNDMRMEPHPTIKDQLVLKTNQGITANMDGFGAMTAQQLEIFCVLAAGNNWILDQISVRDNVLFETASGTCKVNQLHIFFVNVTPDGREIRSSRMPQTFAQASPVPPSMAFGGVAFGGAVVVQQPTVQNPTVQNPITQVQHLQPLMPQNMVAPIPLYQPAAPHVAAPIRITPHRTEPRSLETQNLMGINSSPGGKFDMTGNQMRMRVRIQSGQSAAEIVEIEGNVHLKESVANNSAQNVSQTMPIEIFGDIVTIWDPSEPTTKIKIARRASSNDAIFKGRGVELSAGELNISRADNMFWSPGPGRLVAHPSQMNMQGIPTSSASDDILTVEWNREMKCDGLVLQFIGHPDASGNRVKAAYQTQTLECNEMQIRLNRQVMFFDDQSSVVPRAVSIQCVHNVRITNRQLDAQGNQRSLDILRLTGGAMLQYDVDNNYFLAEGPGEFSSVFVGSAQGFDLNAQNNAQNNVQNNADTLNHLSVWFPDQMQGRLLGDKKEVDIRGRKVMVAYSPANSWDDRIGIENFSAARLRGYTLECERLQIEEIVNPLNPSQSFMELTASDTAIIEGPGGLYGRAHAIRFNQARSTVDLDGASGSVTLVLPRMAQMQGQPPRVEARRLVYNIATGTFEIIEVQGGGIR